MQTKSDRLPPMYEKSLFLSFSDMERKVNHSPIKLITTAVKETAAIKVPVSPFKYIDTAPTAAVITKDITERVKLNQPFSEYGYLI